MIATGSDNPRRSQFPVPSRTILHPCSHLDPLPPPKSSPFRRTAALAPVATAVGLAASPPAQAQRPSTFPSAAAFKRIWRIGMDSSRVDALG
jgi:hypothetical protein